GGPRHPLPDRDARGGDEPEHRRQLAVPPGPDPGVHPAGPGDGCVHLRGRRHAGRHPPQHEPGAGGEPRFALRPPLPLSRGRERGRAAAEGCGGPFPFLISTSPGGRDSGLGGRYLDARWAGLRRPHPPGRNRFTRRARCHSFQGSTPMAKTLLIDGTWRASSTGDTIPVVDPSTGEVFDALPRGTAADVDAAVAAARRAFERVWSRTPPVERGRILARLG